MVLPSTINKKNVDKVLKFIQTMCYYGIGDESVTEKGVRIYKQLKRKKIYVASNQTNSLPILLLAAIKYGYDSRNWFVWEWLDDQPNVQSVWFFNIKQIWMNWLNLISPEIIENTSFLKFKRSKN